MMVGGGTAIVPAEAYTMALQVRSYEVGRDGRIGLGSVLRYLEYVATEASTARGFDWRWYEAHGSAWVVRDMRLRLGLLPGIGERLELATWLSSWGRVQAYREYAVWEPESGHLLVRGQARWAYVDRVRGTPLRIHDELLVRFGVPGHPMRAAMLPVAAAAPDSTTRTLDLTARTYETDINQHINNTVYADWLSEGLAAARAPGLPWQLRATHITYARPALPGEAIRVETSHALHGSRGLRVMQRITGAASGTEHVRASALYLATDGARLPA
jgi:acyl-ACP thioesterase